MIFKHILSYRLQVSDIGINQWGDFWSPVDYKLVEIKMVKAYIFNFNIRKTLHIQLRNSRKHQRKERYAEVSRRMQGVNRWEAIFFKYNILRN